MRPVTVITDSPHGGWARVERRKVDRTGRRCSCDKQAYSSKKHAKQTAAHQSRVTGERIEAYHCYQGHCYHIGHPPRRLHGGDERHDRASDHHDEPDSGGDLVAGHVRGLEQQPITHGRVGEHVQQHTTGEREDEPGYSHVDKL